MSVSRWLPWCAVCLWVAGCSSDAMTVPLADASTSTSDGATADAAVGTDAAVVGDAAHADDASTADLGDEADAEVVDAELADATLAVDAGSDAAEAHDAMVDASFDAAPHDDGGLDMSALDLAVMFDADVAVDAETGDAEVAHDASSADAGPELVDCTGSSDIVLNSLSDLAVLITRGCHTIDSLTVPDASTLSTIEVAHVRRVVNGVSIVGDAATQLNLPDLESVGMAFSIDAPLSDLSLPSLRTVGTGLTGLTIKNTSLTTIELPELEYGFGYFTGASGAIADNGLLEEVRLPSFVHANGILWIRDNPALSVIDMPLLQHGGVLWIDGFAGTSLEFPNLEDMEFRATTPGTYGDLRVADAPNLVSFSAPSLSIAKMVTFRGNDALTTVSLTSLVTVEDDLIVTDNNALLTFSAPALEEVGRNASATGNGLLCDFVDPGLVAGTYTFDNPC